MRTILTAVVREVSQDCHIRYFFFPILPQHVKFTHTVKGMSHKTSHKIRYSQFIHISIPCSLVFLFDTLVVKDDDDENDSDHNNNYYNKKRVPEGKKRKEKRNRVACI